MLGYKIDIKPSYVLAGLQADKTNVWLQQIFTAATSGVDSTPFVAKIIGGLDVESCKAEDTERGMNNKRKSIGNQPVKPDQIDLENQPTNNQLYS